MASSLVTKAALAVIAGVVVGIVGKTIAEDKRASTPCKFEDGITKEDFERIAKNVAASFKKVKNVQVKGPIVSGEVRTLGGITSFEFAIDFNDYGHITGRYWLATDDEDSDIPEKLAKRIGSAIKSFSGITDLVV